MSPHRLRAPHPWPGHWWIALVDEDGAAPCFAVVDGTKGEDRIARAWADLYERRYRNLARQAACRDGVPPRAARHPGRCSECGLLAAQHQVPGSVEGPIFPETHVHWQGLGDITAVEAAMRLAIAVRRGPRSTDLEPVGDLGERETLTGADGALNAELRGMLASEIASDAIFLADADVVRLPAASVAGSRISSSGVTHLLVTAPRNPWRSV